MKNPQFDSLVWGSLTLAPIIHWTYTYYTIMILHACLIVMCLHPSLDNEGVVCLELLCEFLIARNKKQEKVVHLITVSPFFSPILVSNCIYYMHTHSYRTIFSHIYSSYFHSPQGLTLRYSTQVMPQQ